MANRRTNSRNQPRNRNRGKNKRDAAANTAKPPASPPGPPPSSEHSEGGGKGDSPREPQSAEQRAEEESREKIERIDKIVLANLFLAAATAVSGIVATFYGCGQLAEMRVQNDQTNKTLELMRVGQRPWLVGVAVPIDPLDTLLDPNATVRDLSLGSGNWAMKVRNVGETPAINFRGYMDWYPSTDREQVFGFDADQVRDDLTNIASYMPFPKEDITIAPGEEVIFRISDSSTDHSRASFVSPDPDDRVRQYHQSRIAGGFIYDDPWGGKHTMFCCFRHQPLSGQLELEESSMDYEYNQDPRHSRKDQPIIATMPISVTGKELLKDSGVWPPDYVELPDSMTAPEDATRAPPAPDAPPPPSE